MLKSYKNILKQTKWRDYCYIDNSFNETQQTIHGEDCDFNNIN